MKPKHISCQSPALVVPDIRNCKWVLFLGMIGKKRPPVIEWQADHELGNLCTMLVQFGRNHGRFCRNF